MKSCRRLLAFFQWPDQSLVTVKHRQLAPDGCVHFTLIILAIQTRPCGQGTPGEKEWPLIEGLELRPVLARDHDAV